MSLFKNTFFKSDNQSQQKDTSETETKTENQTPAWVPEKTPRLLELEKANQELSQMMAEIAYYAYEPIQDILKIIDSL